MKTTELQIKENSEGDLYFNIPDNLLERLGWEEGDEIKFVEKDGGFVLTKVKYKTIELDFDDEELLKYMVFAHEQGITFNELCERAVKEKIGKEEYTDDQFS